MLSGNKELSKGVSNSSMLICFSEIYSTILQTYLQKDTKYIAYLGDFKNKLTTQMSDYANVKSGKSVYQQTLHNQQLHCIDILCF